MYKSTSNFIGEVSVVAESTTNFIGEVSVVAESTSNFIVEVSVVAERASNFIVEVSVIAESTTNFIVGVSVVAESTSNFIALLKRFENSWFIENKERFQFFLREIVQAKKALKLKMRNSLKASAIRHCIVVTTNYICI